jgi:hypothetical protein
MMLYQTSNLRYKSGRLLVTVRVRHYGRGDATLGAETRKIRNPM